MRCQTMESMTSKQTQENFICKQINWLVTGTKVMIAIPCWTWEAEECLYTR